MLNTHTVLEAPIPTDEQDKMDPCNVYDAPSKKSPTSNSISGSACSIFSIEEGQHMSSAQPYEKPLVTPLGSRLNLFPSSSTLDNIAGAETLSKPPLHLQLNQTGTLTLDRLRVLRAKKPRLKPAAASPDKESKECPVLVLSEKPPKAKAPTPEEAEPEKKLEVPIIIIISWYCSHSPIYGFSNHLLVKCARAFFLYRGTVYVLMMRDTALLDTL